MKLRDHLLTQIRTSPSIYQDWEMKRELHRQLSSLSAAELEMLFKEPIEGRTQEVREMKNQILAAWVLKDAPAALNASGEGCVHVFNTWGFHDREAALTWLRDAELTGPLAGKRQTMRINFLSWLARIDFPRAEQEWHNMDPTERKVMLGVWTDESKDNPGIRERIRELAIQQSDGSELKKVDRNLLQQLAKSDANAARGKVDKMELPAAERADMEVSILKGEAGEQPVEAFNHWLARHPADQPVPESFWDTLDQSFTFKREETVRWLDSLEAGPIRDAMHERGSRLLASKGEFDKAAGYIDTISDPDRRVNAIKILKTLWTDEDAVNAWLETLPKEDRGRIGEE